jgi:uncharacterized protein
MIRTEMGAADLTSSVMAAPEGEAFFELGMKYASGRSGPADLVTAHKWFNVALVHKSLKLLRFLRIYETCILAKPLISLDLRRVYAPTPRKTERRSPVPTGDTPWRT